MYNGSKAAQTEKKKVCAERAAAIAEIWNLYLLWAAIGSSVTLARVERGRAPGKSRAKLRSLRRNAHLPPT